MTITRRASKHKLLSAPFDYIHRISQINIKRVSTGGSENLSKILSHNIDIPSLQGTHIDMIKIHFIGVVQPQWNVLLTTLVCVPQRKNVLVDKIYHFIGIATFLDNNFQNILMCLCALKEMHENGRVQMIQIGNKEISYLRSTKLLSLIHTSGQLIYPITQKILIATIHILFNNYNTTTITVVSQRKKIYTSKALKNEKKLAVGQTGYG